MKETIATLKEVVAFLLLMFVLGICVIGYVIFTLLYWLYAKVTGQEHLIK